MKVTFPHLGNSHIAIACLLRALGHEPVVPPPTTKRTLQLGCLYSPEEICLPFKIVLGNMLEGIEQGADCVLMIGGWGPCRLGYYAEIHRLLVENLGHQVEFITLEVPRGSYAKYYQRYRRLLAPARLSTLKLAPLAWAKLRLVEELEELALKARPREWKQGSASRLLRCKLQRVEEAQSLAELTRIRRAAPEEFQALMDPHQPEPLRIGVVGEIYTVAEPFASLRLEERLGYLGVEVVRTISLRQWVVDHVFKKALGLDTLGELKKSAAGYLRGFIGGHGLESVARSVQLSKENLSGIVHILPLSCMPEVVAQGILPQVSCDHGLPILSLVVDEHTGETGFQTRLEAFVDMLRRRAEQGVRQTASLSGG